MKKRKAGSLALIAITAMLIYGAATLFAAALRLGKTENANSALRAEIRAAENERKRLLALISDCGSDKAMEDLARVRFSLVTPDEIVFPD